MSMNLEELDFPHTPPAYYHHVGPMVLEEPGEPEHPAVKIAEQAKEAGRKVIYCTFGSILEGDPRLLQSAIDAVAKREEWTLLVSSRVDPSLIDLDASNVHLFDFVPQKEVLKYSHCCIHHAGINTVNECLHFGVPTLIYNAEVVDENGVTARLDFHRLAKIGDKTKDGALELGEHLKELLSNPAWQQRTEYFRQIYQSKAQESQLLQLVREMA